VQFNLQQFSLAANGGGHEERVWCAHIY